MAIATAIAAAATPPKEKTRLCAPLPLPPVLGVPSGELGLKADWSVPKSTLQLFLYWKTKSLFKAVVVKS